MDNWFLNLCSVVSLAGLYASPIWSAIRQKEDDIAVILIGFISSVIFLTSTVVRGWEI